MKGGIEKYLPGNTFTPSTYECVDPFLHIRCYSRAWYILPASLPDRGCRRKDAQISLWRPYRTGVTIPPLQMNGRKTAGCALY